MNYSATRTHSAITRKIGKLRTDRISGGSEREILPALMRAVGGDRALISCAHSRSLPQAVSRLTMFSQFARTALETKWSPWFQRNATQRNEAFGPTERKWTLKYFFRRSSYLALES